MKRTILMLAICMISAWAPAVLVDDFESYAAGTAGSPWVTTEASMYANIALDGGNKYITTWSNSGSGYRDVARQLAPEASPISALSTLYLRAYVTSDSIVDFAFGLCGDAAGTTGGDGIGSEWYADYGPYFRLISNGTVGDNLVELSVRNGGGFVDDLAYLNTGQWYNFWLVINPASGTGTFDLYYAADGGTATLARAANGFRDAYSTPLQCFLIMTNGADSSVPNVRVDNIHVMSGSDLNVPSQTKPYSPSVEQGETSGSDVPTILKWKAGEDPDGVYAVNPDIVDQYVFMGSDLDPNLRYVGATGADPGTDVPDSQYSLTRTVDRTYYWAIVEAIEGYEESLNTGDLISVVDANNIVGPTWSYQSTPSVPTIVAHPVDARVFPVGHPQADPNAVFTVTFTTVYPVTATWYKNDAVITPDGVNVIVTTGGTSSTLEIKTPEPGDEGKYYCMLSNQPGTFDDTYSATRLLIIKKELANFEFENNLDDSSANGAPSGAARYVNPLDPNELQSTPAAVSYPDGITGKAVGLTSGQYIDMGIEGYPKAGPLDTIGDHRGTQFDKVGFGRGMEQGSILCWVKPASTGAIYVNANDNSAPETDDTHFGLTTTATNNARAIVRGENAPDGGYQEIGTAAGGLQMTDFSLQDGQWHMFAATWSNDTIRVYINGEQVGTTTAGTPEMYHPWERPNLIGASRTVTRHILTDFYTGAVDSLRVYNYEISAADIATEYETLSGNTPCSSHSFDGYLYNFDNTADSYCKVDLLDFMMLAKNWLNTGLYEE